MSRPNGIPEDAQWGTNSLGNHWWRLADGQFGYINKDDSIYYNNGQEGPTIAEENSTYISPQGDEHVTLRRSDDDGYLYERTARRTNARELRWKDILGNVFKDPSMEILPISLGGYRDVEVEGLVWGEDSWEPCPWELIGDRKQPAGMAERRAEMEADREAEEDEIEVEIQNEEEAVTRSEDETEYIRGEMEDHDSGLGSSDEDFEHDLIGNPYPTTNGQQLLSPTFMNSQNKSQCMVLIDQRGTPELALLLEAGNRIINESAVERTILTRSCTSLSSNDSCDTQSSSVNDTSSQESRGNGPSTPSTVNRKYRSPKPSTRTQLRRNRKDRGIFSNARVSKRLSTPKVVSLPTPPNSSP